MHYTNQDEHEIAKFSHLAHQWWDPKGPLRTLHDINPARLSYIQQRTTLAGKYILDVGCGAGLLTESMVAVSGIVTGIDLSQEALAVAKCHHEGINTTIDYQLISVESLANTHPHSFEVITCLEMLEHVPDPRSTIQACATLAKSGADLFFSTLNRNIKSYFGAIVAAEYLLKLIPKNTHDYRKFIQPAELDAWLRETDLIPADIVGLHYNPLSKQCKLNRDVTINYIIHAKKP